MSKHSDKELESVLDKEPEMDDLRQSLVDAFKFNLLLQIAMCGALVAGFGSAWVNGKASWPSLVACTVILAAAYLVIRQIKGWKFSIRRRLSIEALKRRGYTEEQIVSALQK